MIDYLESYKEYFGNPRKFIEEFCYITTKEGTFEKFKLNYPQEKLMRMIEKCLEEKKTDKDKNT